MEGAEREERKVDQEGGGWEIGEGVKFELLGVRSWAYIWKVQGQWVRDLQRVNALGNWLNSDRNQECSFSSQTLEEGSLHN